MEFNQEDVAKNKGMAMLAYLPFFFLVPYFSARESRFAQFHVNQGFILSLAAAVLWIVSGSFGFLLMLIPIFGWICNFIFGLLKLVWVVLMLMGILHSSRGEARELPYIGRHRLI